MSVSNQNQRALKGLNLCSPWPCRQALHTITPRNLLRFWHRISWYLRHHVLCPCASPSMCPWCFCSTEMIFTGHRSLLYLGTRINLLGLGVRGQRSRSQHDQICQNYHFWGCKLSQKAVQFAPCYDNVYYDGALTDVVACKYESVMQNNLRCKMHCIHHNDGDTEKWLVTRTRFKFFDCCCCNESTLSSSATGRLRCCWDSMSFAANDFTYIHDRNIMLEFQSKCDTQIHGLAIKHTHCMHCRPK